MNSSDEFNIFAPLPTGTLVLEASAGTGKTWTIAAMVARLIAETDTAVADLLIITFTRAAASELRSRIRERLVDLATDLSALAAGAQRLTAEDSVLFFLATGVTPRQGPIPALLDPRELAVRISRLELAASELDTATITTIHSFLHLALKGFGVAGDPDAELAMEGSLDYLCDEATADTYLEFFMNSAEPGISYADAKEIARSAVRSPLAPFYPPEQTGEAESVALLRAFGTRVRERVEQRKRETGIIGYDDLLVKMAEIIDPQESIHLARAKRAREYLRGRWSHVFVDEFQDTDEIQWRILRSVFDGRCNLVLIGDPKQAIYAFRGGDLHTYLSAAERAQTRKTLLHNYRSDGALLTGLNVLLTGANLGDPRIAVPQVESGLDEARVRFDPQQADHRLRLRIIDGGGGNVGAPEVRKQVVADVVADIAHLLTGETEVRDGPGADATWRGVRGRDIAVLCRSNSDTKLFHEALLAHGINAVRGGGISVFESDAAEEWNTLLTAMERPSSRESLAAAALGSFFGHDSEQLVKNRDGVLADVSEKLRTLTSLLTRYGIASVLEAALGDSNDGMAIRVLGRVGGERLLTDLQHLGELMHEAHPRAGAHTLLAWLGQQQDNPEQSEHPRRLESDDSAVVVSTLHLAKGMEYPFVYLPTTPLGSFRRRGYPSQHVEGERVIPLTRAKAITEGYRAEWEGEEARLVYVGLTRGVGQVTAYWAPTSSPDHKALHRLLVNRVKEFSVKDPAETVVSKLHQELGPAVHAEVLTKRTPPPITGGEPPKIGEAKAWTRVIDSTWRRSSYTSLAQAAERADTGVEAEWEFKEDPRSLDQTPAVGASRTGGVCEAEASRQAGHLPSPMADLPRGAHFGSLVHGILETVDFRAADLPREISTRIREQLRHWPQDLPEDELAEAIYAVLTTPLHPAVPGPLTAIDPREKLAELDFEIPLDGGLYASGCGRVTLGQVAVLLRTHLEPSDPLYSYADVLQGPEYGEQTLRGYLTGSIDLVFGWDGKYYVADYKTNWLGSTEEPATTAAYDLTGVRAAMEGSSYPLQALLYTVALHRYLRWRLVDYDPGSHIGGVLYLYVRGMAGPDTPVIDGHSAGVFTWIPPPALVIALSALFDEGVQDA